MSNNYGNEDSISMSMLYMHLINNFEKNSHALIILFECFYLYTYPRIKTDET